MTVGLLLIWVPSFLIVWVIDEGTYPAQSLSGQIGSAYFEFLRFPIVRMIHELTKSSESAIVSITGSLGFFAGFLVDALLYSGLFYYIWHRLVGHRKAA